MGRMGGRMREGMWRKMGRGMTWGMRGLYNIERPEGEGGVMGSVDA